MKHIRTPLLLIAIAFLLTCVTTSFAETPVNQLTHAEKLAGWESIFDGKTTEGWRNYKKDSISDAWKVIDGNLVRNGKGAGDIVTEKQYKNFELSIEYRISKGGNSGIMFHVSEDEKTPWMTGPEIQVQDNVDGHDPQLAGWLYQLYKPSNSKSLIKRGKAVGIDIQETPDTTRPVGQWNQIYLRISPAQSQVIMNGVKYYTFVKGDDDWNKRVAESKFSKFPRFGKNEQGHICLQDHGNEVAYRNIKVRDLGDDLKPTNPVDGEVNVKAVSAFPKLNWEGWEGISEETGKEKPLRPLVLTHAADGSNRNFAMTQSGTIHVFKNDPNCEQTKLFLDISSKVRPWKGAGSNEEGMLGLAFHPKYKENGYFYVYYTSNEKEHKSILSRFSVDKNDPNKADPSSEQVLMEIAQPFQNHNGGSILFGHDGMLYIGMGDGGLANDAMGNGQNLSTLLGSILRIDVDGKSGDKNYGIPKDNPFVDRKGACPEIYAYGVRNAWRLSIDSKTGDIWFADVGQDLWEEINILKRGGNYGWSIREASNPFGNRAAGDDADPIAPVWEYDHQIGKSITGGIVYRGKSAPELTGMYIYADFVSTEIWALEYDREAGKLKRNMKVPVKTIPIMGFGEDEQGEAYFMGQTVTGTDIYKFMPTK